MESFPEGVLVVENKGKVIGFLILEILNKGDVPKDFCDMRLEEPIKGRYACVVAFTTKLTIRT